jgi:hypothetical protein
LRGLFAQSVLEAIGRRPSLLETGGIPLRTITPDDADSGSVRQGYDVGMFSKLSGLLLLAVSLCAACDCREPSVEVKRDHAEIIFRATIVELRDSSKPSSISGFGRDLGKNVVFRVSNVWKGHVGQTFEMRAIEETTMCVGFWPDYLKVGEDLLVYATRFGDSEFLTAICGQHKRAKDALGDFKILGPGKAPESSIQVPK